jgi:hypothetical protein
VSELLSATDIVAAVIAAKGFDTGDRVLQPAIGELVKATLAPMASGPDHRPAP